MASEKIKKILIIFLLGSLSISAFFIRLENFENSRARTIDEIVYHRMGIQVKQDISQYNTIAYGKELASNGRELPAYFFQPLYKHPPIFTFLISSSLRLFGNSLFSAGYVSIFLAALMIPMIYLLGRLLFDRSVGILAAIFLWMDPVSIICSQKVWPDTSIAFFTLLSVLLFCYAIKNKGDYFFILSGIASGLATNVKYPGILVTIGIATFALIYRKDLFRSKKFWMGLVMPFITLIPWIAWNYRVYGSEVIKRQGIMHSAFQHVMREVFSSRNLAIIAMLFVVALVLYIYSRRRKEKMVPSKANTGPWSITWWKDIVLGAVSILVIIVLHQHIFNSLDLTFIPRTSWYMGSFANESSAFYFGRLIEFSFVYIFAFAAFFINKGNEADNAAILRVSTLVMLVFFIAWRNFQSRYILGSIPLLLLLASDVIVSLWRKVLAMDSFALRLALKISMAVILLLIFTKAYIINTSVSFPNDLCYF